MCLPAGLHNFLFRRKKFIEKKPVFYERVPIGTEKTTATNNGIKKPPIPNLISSFESSFLWSAIEVDSWDLDKKKNVNVGRLLGSSGLALVL